MIKLFPLIIGTSVLLPSATVELHLNKNIDYQKGSIEKNIIAGWDPNKTKKGPQLEANKKTIIALEKFREMPELKPYFKKAKGYAVFPSVGKGGIGIGGSRGKGELFQNGKVTGATTLTQLSVGFQLGAQAFSQIIFFKAQRDINRFTQGNFEFGASASAALINQGAAVETAYSNGIAVSTISKGGLMYEASIGGQKFTYEPYE